MNTLWIAIGNPLRGDDNAAHVLALQAEPDVTVRDVMQLTPELAAEFTDFSRVMFLDADVNTECVSIAPLEETRASRRLISHHIDPTTVVALARRLYGWDGEALLCRIPASDFETCSWKV